LLSVNTKDRSIYRGFNSPENSCLSFPSLLSSACVGKTDRVSQIRTLTYGRSLCPEGTKIGHIYGKKIGSSVLWIDGKLASGWNNTEDGERGWVWYMLQAVFDYNMRQGQEIRRW